MIAVSEVHELLTKIHVILDSVVSKWVDNMAHILASLFNFWHLGSMVESGVPSFMFFTVLRILFLLVRLACMVASICLWYRLTNNPHLNYPSP